MANIERTLTAKKTLRKKNTAGGIFLSHFKLHHRPVVTTTVRNRHMDSRKEERAQEWTHIDVVSSWKSNQEWATRKGQSSEETGTGKLATYTKEHHWSSSRSSNRNLTKNPPFCTWSSFPPESSEMDLQSALSWTWETSTSSSFFPLAVPPCWGTESTLLLSAWLQPRYPEARVLAVLRKHSSCQLVTEPSLKAKRPAPAGQSGFWRPLQAAREEQAAPCSQTSEGSPRNSSAVSTQTGSPNWNGAE